MEQSTKSVDVVVAGGGAAGYFAAIAVAEALPGVSVCLLETGREVLRKVRISGGGRCNVTHHCWDPEQLAAHYPRGSRALRAAFHRWQPRDTVEWFAGRGVSLKTEADGRMFPVTDDSETIVACLEKSAAVAGVEVRRQTSLRSFKAGEGQGIEISLNSAGQWRAGCLCLAVGSLKDSPLVDVLKATGHRVEPLVPSLFALNCADSRLQGLAGLSVERVQVSLAEAGARGAVQEGPLLVTHRGFSGPAILRLSAWEARRLAALKYAANLRINWLGGMAPAEAGERIEQHRRDDGIRLVKSRPWGGLPRRLWETLVEAAGIGPELTWAHVSRVQAANLIQTLVAGEFKVQGKTTNKDEFVTCGGVDLRDVDMRRMESRKLPGLFLAGECMDIDGVTGGFNFQAAWTTGMLAARGMAERLSERRGAPDQSS